jgi:hypothetical protein
MNMKKQVTEHEKIVRKINANTLKAIRKLMRSGSLTPSSLKELKTRPA